MMLRFYTMTRSEQHMGRVKSISKIISYDSGHHGYGLRWLEILRSYAADPTTIRGSCNGCRFTYTAQDAGYCVKERRMRGFRTRAKRRERRVPGITRRVTTSFEETHSQIRFVFYSVMQAALSKRECL